MGAIKDVVDLLTQLANRVQDRRLAAELNTIQSLILNIQSKHAELHETNIQLLEERHSLKERIQELEAQLAEGAASPSTGPKGVPTCPNCSTKSKPFYMKPVPPDFVSILNATHECPKCKYNTNIK
jgi:uncharacterized protein with PIN domain